MSGWRPAYVGDRIRLGRMLQVNGSFNSFDSGFPTWWTKYDQTSYFQSTAFPHSGPLSMQVVCNSQAVASTMLQHPAKRYATWSAYQTEPVDYFLDGQTHTIKFAAWLNPAGVSSGSFRLVMVASGVNAYSTWLSSGADWN